MTDPTEEMEIYVDQELLTRAKGALMLDEGREPTTEEVIGKALQALVDEHTDDSPTIQTRPEPLIGGEVDTDDSIFDTPPYNPFENPGRDLPPGHPYGDRDSIIDD